MVPRQKPISDERASHPVDAFVAASLRSLNLPLTDRESPWVLCRRLYLDFTGLPPSPDDLAAFERDGLDATLEKLLDGRFKSEKRGQCGMELSEVLPQTAEIADAMFLIRTMRTEAVNHAPAQVMMNTGSQQCGRLSFGSWTLYGLGIESADLPGEVVLTSAQGISGGASNYGTGFLSTIYGEIPFRSSGHPVLYLSNPAGIDEQAQRPSPDAISRLNELSLQSLGDPQTAARIQSYEMTYRIQTTVPELMDRGSEPQHILNMYGTKDPKEANYARNCLLSRRLIERGVRFVQLFHEAWYQHGNLTGGVKQNAADTDKASAALVKDLKQGGLLNDTLVIREANSDARRWSRVATTVVIHITAATACGWQAAE